MYLGLKIAHSAFTGNYRSDQASTWHPCAFWRWQMDVPALFCISFLEGCVITVQINCNPALGRAAPKGKIRGKSSPCVALAATWSGHPRLRSHQRLPGLYRGCSMLGNRSMGTDFVLCPWQVQCRTCGPRTKVAASPLRCVALGSHEGCRGFWHTFSQARAALVESRAPWASQLSCPQVWSWH